MSKFIIGCVVLFVIYIAIRTLMVLRPTNDIDEFLKNTKKKFKELTKQAEKASKIGQHRLDEVLQEVTQLKNDFIRDQIFNDRDLRPTGDQYRSRSELIEKMNILENRLDKAISTWLEVH